MSLGPGDPLSERERMQEILSFGAQKRVLAAPFDQEFIVFSIGNTGTPGTSDIKLFEIETGEVQHLTTVREQVRNIVVDEDKTIFLEVSDLTPKGHYAHTIFMLEAPYEEATRLFPEEEVHRHSLAIAAGKPHYIRNDRYVGASGGTPWYPPDMLCVWSDSSEVQIAEVKGATSFHRSGAIAQGQIPFERYVGPDQDPPYALSLVDVVSGSVTDLGYRESMSSAALSPQGEYVAIKIRDFNRDVIDYVEVIDVSTGQVVATYDVPDMERLFYGLDGELYIVDQTEAGESAVISRLRDGKVTVVGDLK